MTHLLLASASPARLATLRNAGFDPEVAVSGIDEAATLAAAQDRFGQLDPADTVLLLAQAKAQAVADTYDGPHEDLLIIGCDSLLEFDGETLGKPGDAATATQRWQQLRGRSGQLHTGHWLIDDRSPAAGGTGATLGATATAQVHFAEITDAEIADYVATGEPLAVAGGFTIDGFGGSFIDRIEGDPHAVVGISLPLLRELLTSIGVSVTSLWRR